MTFVTFRQTSANKERNEYENMNIVLAQRQCEKLANMYSRKRAYTNAGLKVYYCVTATTEDQCAEKLALFFPIGKAVLVSFQPLTPFSFLSKDKAHHTKIASFWKCRNFLVSA